MFADFREVDGNIWRKSAETGRSISIAFGGKYGSSLDPSTICRAWFESRDQMQEMNSAELRAHWQPP
jgi:hypothetical protein